MGIIYIHHFSQIGPTSALMLLVVFIVTDFYSFLSAATVGTDPETINFLKAGSEPPPERSCT